jgi:hypothetical protein
VSKLAAAIGDEFIDRARAEERRKLGDLDKARADYGAWLERTAAVRAVADDGE